MNGCLQAGTLLDYYRLDRLVAIGGMSTVFRATDTRTGAPVAVKIPHVQRQSLIQRWFFSKSQALRKLHHRGLVQTLGVVHTARSYVVMEWVEGRLLRELMNEGIDLSVERSIQIAIELCDVLAYIHDSGLVHLDLKPDNIIVDWHDGVRLIDFDHARASNGLRNLMSRGKTGTPDYASPEQIRGKAAGPSSDLYSLGLILYEMLTGAVPFSGVAPFAAANLRVLADPPSLGEINPEVPEDLQDLVSRAIARDPRARPATAHAFCAELDLISKVLAHEVIPAVR